MFKFLLFDWSEYEHVEIIFNVYRYMYQFAFMAEMAYHNREAKCRKAVGMHISKQKDSQSSGHKGLLVNKQKHSDSRIKKDSDCEVNLKDLGDLPRLQKKVDIKLRFLSRVSDDSDSSSCDESDGTDDSADDYVSRRSKSNMN